MTASIPPKLFKAVHGRAIEEVVRELYDSGLTQAQVGERLGVSRWTVAKWMAEYRIPTRDRRLVA